MPGTAEPDKIERTSDSRSEFDAAVERARSRAAEGDEDALRELIAACTARREHAPDSRTLADEVSVLCAAIAEADEPGGPDRLYQVAVELDELEDPYDAAKLEAAITAGRAALAAMPVNHAERASCASLLGRCLCRQGELTGSLANIREGAAELRTALTGLADDDPDWIDYLLLYRLALLRLYQFEDGPGVLAEWDEVAGRTLTAAGTASTETGSKAEQDNASRHDALTGLDGMLALFQFERHGSDESLRKAVTLLRAAYDGIADDDYLRPVITANFVHALWRVYERSADEAALREAVALGRSAVADLSDDENANLVQINLTGALTRLYELTGETALGHEAVDHGRAAMQAATTPEATFISGANLATALFTLGMRTGDLAALREAERLSRGAAESPHADPLNRAVALMNAGGSSRVLYAYTGDLPTLREGISVLRTAAEQLPDDSPHLAMCLANLSGALDLLAARTLDESSSAASITAARTALAASRPGDYVRWLALNCLASALESRYRRTGDTDAAREMILARRAAVDADSIPYRRGTSLGQLCGSLLFLIRNTGNLGMIREAVAAGRAAQAVLPVGSQARGTTLPNLGEALVLLQEATGDRAVLDEAIAVYEETAALRSAMGLSQVNVWRGLARTHMAADGADGALAAMERAVAELPAFASRGLRREDRESRLGEIAGTASQAAATALAAGRPIRALELLEEARGRLLAEAMGDRDQVARLADRSPQFAGEFERLQREFARLEAADLADGAPGLGTDVMTSAGTYNGTYTASLAQARERAELRERTAADQARLLAGIRAIPEFADFMLPASAARLRTLAQRTPIITVVTDPARCDALILTADEADPVLHVPLPDLRSVEAGLQAGRFRDARRSAQDELTPRNTRMSAQQTMLEVLAWLWDTIASPILTALGHNALPDPATGQRWPRVWWCPVGVLSFLPLHAAGHHLDLAEGAANPRTVLDRVVSSYTSTIRALGVSAAASDSRRARRPLIVAVPEAPGAPLLAQVPLEARVIADLLPGASVLDDASATHDAVLAALRAHDVVHFACHGVGDWAAPQASRLLLHDQPLLAKEISELRLTADLAYLSACDTAAPPPRLADEALHLTSAFQLAGFTHVVGTLWPVNDTAAARIAREFYSELTASGALDVNDTALALHNAVRRCRTGDGPGYESWLRAPTRWAGYVHVGG